MNLNKRTIIGYCADCGYPYFEEGDEKAHQSQCAAVDSFYIAGDVVILKKAPKEPMFSKWLILSVHRNGDSYVYTACAVAYLQLVITVKPEDIEIWHD